MANKRKDDRPYSTGVKRVKGMGSDGKTSTTCTPRLAAGLPEACRRRAAVDGCVGAARGVKIASWRPQRWGRSWPTGEQQRANRRKGGGREAPRWGTMRQEERVEAASVRARAHSMAGRGASLAQRQLPLRLTQIVFGACIALGSMA